MRYYVMNDMLVGVRDPHGIRPLILGKVGDAYVPASETCALDIIGASYIRDIDAGEMVSISKDGIESRRIAPEEPSRFCIFLNIFILPAQIQFWKASQSIRRAKILAPSWQPNPLLMPI